MNIKEDSVENQIRQYFNKCLFSYKVTENRKVVVFHCGTFSQDLVNSLALKNEDLMMNAGDKKIVVKRIFSILIEGLQNIRFHGEKDENDNQLGFLMIAKDKATYKISFGNLIKSSNVGFVISQIKYLNSLDFESVKSLYSKALSENVFSEKGGAGLGFITMKMKSNNDLNFNWASLNEKYSFFSVEVLINRLD